MVLRDHGFSSHVLTKSPMIVRDLDVLTSFDCMVTVSLLSVDSMLAEVFEPCVVSPQERLALVRTLRDAGVVTGVALIPFLPMLAEPSLKATIAAVADAHASFLVAKLLELKGEQRDRFFDVLQKHYPDVLKQYQQWYQNAISMDKTNQRRLERTVKDLCRKHRVQYGLSK
jgi:DNA repair photolyase